LRAYLKVGKNTRNKFLGFFLLELIICECDHYPLKKYENTGIGYKGPLNIVCKSDSTAENVA
jgi:hypothetical protein